jgi:hypothetical protein
MHEELIGKIQLSSVFEYYVQYLAYKALPGFLQSEEGVSHFQLFIPITPTPLWA